MLYTKMISGSVENEASQATMPTDSGVKFDPVQSGLPLEMGSQCLKCAKILKGRLFKENGKVVLEKTCPDHGPQKEFLNDSSFTPEAVSDVPGSDNYTYTGHKVNPIVRPLPKTVETLCPVCIKNIVGRIYEWEGKVYMEKTCPEHGYVKDVISSDVKLYNKFAKWSFEEGRGLTNPQIKNASHCPTQCGLCNMHQSHTVLGNIDLTNRCNLTCPICFANANVQGYVYEPSYDEIVKMLKVFREERPIPGVAIQFSGGEPTIHPEFFRILSAARDLGFSQIQIATNGIKMSDLEFARKAKEAGLHTLYLQFDGVGDEVYEQTRGRKLWEIKKKVVENCRQVDLKVCLVPTIVNTVNDDQIGKILDFAVENIDVVSGISYQPVCFTGRISEEERERKRFTMADLAHKLEETGYAKADRDFYPLSFFARFSPLIQAVTGQPKISTTCHTDCSAGTYFLVPESGKPIPMSRLFHVDKLFTEMGPMTKRIEKAPFKWMKYMLLGWLFAKNFNKKEAPEGLTIMSFLKTVRGLLDKKYGRGDAGKKTWKTLLAAAMHFQDCYNYNVERVKRCVIHYSTPEGRLFPFCTYNSGPFYRERIEKKYSIPMEEYKKRN